MVILNEKVPFMAYCTFKHNTRYTQTFPNRIGTLGETTNFVNNRKSANTALSPTFLMSFVLLRFSFFLLFWWTWLAISWCCKKNKNSKLKFSILKKHFSTCQSCSTVIEFLLKWLNESRIPLLWAAPPIKLLSATTPTLPLNN